jgi:hypothetical protein
MLTFQPFNGFLKLVYGHNKYEHFKTVNKKQRKNVNSAHILSRRNLCWT